MSTKKPEGTSWWDYLSGKKPDPRPAIPPFPAQSDPEQASSGIEVQESFMDTIRMTAYKAFHKK